MRYSNDLERKQDVITRDNAAIKERYNRMSKELDRLVKKEMEFNQVLAKRLEQQSEVDVLKTQVNKLQVKNESLVQNNTVLEAELTVIKKEILKEKRIQEELTAQKEKQEVKQNELNNTIDSLKIDNQNATVQIELMTNRATITDNKCKQQESDLYDCRD